MGSHHSRGNGSNSDTSDGTGGRSNDTSTNGRGTNGPAINGSGTGTNMPHLPPPESQQSKLMLVKVEKSTRGAPR